MTLPTEKQQPAQDGLLYRKALLYGAQKLGKTITGIGFTDRPLIIDAEGSAEPYECYRAECPDWATFRAIGADLAATPDHGYTALVVDTVDELARHCQEAVVSGLAGRDNDLDAGQYAHPSDFDYGKGWSAVSEEFRLRIGRLCALGLPVLFISHEKEAEVTGRTGTRKVFSPDAGTSGMRKWLLGFVDVILRTAVVPTKDGDRHVIIAQASADNVVGGRTPPGAAPLPPMFSLSGEALFRALSARAEAPKAIEQPEAPQPEEQPAEAAVRQLPIEGEKPKPQRRSRTGAKAA